MESRLWGVEKENGELLLPIAEESTIAALRKAAKVLHGKGSAGAVGQLVLAGYTVVEVTIVKVDQR